MQYNKDVVWLCYLQPERPGSRHAQPKVKSVSGIVENNNKNSRWKENLVVLSLMYNVGLYFIRIKKFIKKENMCIWILKTDFIVE